MNECVDVDVRNVAQKGVWRCAELCVIRKF